MIKSVKVFPGSGRDEVVEDGDVLIVRLKAKPQNNLANNALMKMLSRHYGSGNGSVKILRGSTKSKKIVSIDV